MARSRLVVGMAVVASHDAVGSGLVVLPVSYYFRMTRKKESVGRCGGERIRWAQSMNYGTSIQKSRVN